MKFISIFCVLLITGFSYSQTYRLVESGVKAEISVCTNWKDPERPEVDGVSYPSECTEHQKCSLQLYTIEEPVVVSCNCHVRYSTKHPKYDPSNAFPYSNSKGVHKDRNAAEEEARAVCTYRFNLVNENPEHWVTTIDCGVEYRYLCEDGSIERRRAGTPF